MLESLDPVSPRSPAQDTQPGGCYGSLLEEAPSEAKRPAPEPEDETSTKQPRRGAGPPLAQEAREPLRKSETTREKNKRKQKLGQVHENGG